MSRRLRVLPAGIALLFSAVSVLAAGRPAVVEAARSGDLAALRALVTKKADVNAVDADGATALLWASYHDDLDAADLLIRAGAGVDAATDLGATPLWAAAQNGSEQMVGRLLRAGAHPDTPLASGETPLMVAARSGYAAVVERLLAAGAQADARGARGQTALMWAAAEHHADVVKVLVSHGAGVHLKSDVWSQMMAVPPHGYLPYNRMIPHGGDTALMFAARVGDLESAKALVAAGANVNDADAWGVSAVTLAVHSGFTDLVELLLDKGADPNAAPNGFTALHEAVMRRDERMAASLIRHGADVNTPLKTWTPTRRSSHDWNFAPELVGATPFWLAARFAEPGVMRLLAAHGADPLVVHRGEKMVESKGGKGYEPRREATTALMAALGMGGGAAWIEPEKAGREGLALEAVQIAVELGVDVNAASLDGRTALDAARSLKYASVVQFLESRGARAGSAAAPPAPDPEK